MHTRIQSGELKLSVCTAKKKIVFLPTVTNILSEDFTVQNGQRSLSRFFFFFYDFVDT